MAPASPRPISFKTMPLRTIGHGWTLDLPDEFHERVDDDHYVFWHAGRTIYAVVFKTPAAEAEHALDQLSRDRGLQPLQRFSRKDAGLAGQAWLLPEHTPTGDQYWGLNTWTQSGDSVACVTFYFPHKPDLNDALSTWHTVKPLPLTAPIA